MELHDFRYGSIEFGINRLIACVVRGHKID